MRIHNDSLLRVVFAARMVGGLLVAGGIALASLAIISAIRHPDNDFAWTRLFTGLAGGLPGGVLLVCASMLDRGRIGAFYAIYGIAVVEVLLASAAVMVMMKPHPAALLVPALALAVACGIAWEPAKSLRRASTRTHAPLKPIPSTAVVIPPPPARKTEAKAPQQQASGDTPGAMVIEIRRA